MYSLVCALFISCIVRFGVASLSDYYEGRSALGDNPTIQPYNHGGTGNADGVASLLGKVPDVGASIEHGTDGSYRHSGSIDTETYSGDASLPSLGSTKHTFGDVKTLQALFHGSKLLSVYSAPINNHDSLSVDHAPLDGQHDIKDHDGIYSIKAVYPRLPSVSSVDLTEHMSADAQSLFHDSKFLPTYNDNGNTYGNLNSFSLGHPLYGGLHDAKLYPENGNYIKHLFGSSTSGTLKGAQTLPSTVSDLGSAEYSTHNVHNTHNEEHSNFSALADALVRGWTALLNH